MTIFEEYEKKHSAIRAQLKKAKLSGTINCERVGSSLNVSGQTVRNYLAGDIKDGYLAEAILKSSKQITNGKV